MSYSIAKYTKNYYGDVDRLAPLYHNDDNQEKYAQTFETEEEAREWIDNYCSQDSEYYITKSDIIDYISRDGDNNNYDLDGCNCGCGECSTCHQYRVEQDLDMIK